MRVKHLHSKFTVIATTQRASSVNNHCLDNAEVQLVNLTLQRVGTTTPSKRGSGRLSRSSIWSRLEKIYLLCRSQEVRNIDNVGLAYLHEYCSYLSAPSP
jgi:hypothetical protein